MNRDVRKVPRPCRSIISANHTRTQQSQESCNACVRHNGILLHNQNAFCIRSVGWFTNGGGSFPDIDLDQTRNLQRRMYRKLYQLIYVNILGSLCI